MASRSGCSRMAALYPLFPLGKANAPRPKPALRLVQDTMVRISANPDFEDESTSPVEEEEIMESRRSGRAATSSLKREERHLHPSEIFPLQTWLDYLNAEGRAYSDSLNLGEGYSLRMPGGMDCSSVGLIPGEFDVYASTLKLGLRFPPHPFVVEMLDGYNIGVNQMMPNSWASVFGYIARCKLEDITPSFPAFLKLVTLSKVPQAAEDWLALSYKGVYRTVVGKASKWHFWRKKWVVIHTNDQKMCERMARWTTQPNFPGKNDPLPLVSSDV